MFLWNHFKGKSFFLLLNQIEELKEREGWIPSLKNVEVASPFGTSISSFPKAHNIISFVCFGDFFFRRHAACTLAVDWTFQLVFPVMEKRITRTFYHNADFIELHAHAGWIPEAILLNVDKINCSFFEL